VAGIFTQIGPVWIGELETRPKTVKKLMVGTFFIFIGKFFSLMSATALVQKVQNGDFQP
jgi:hypothetical protein